MHDQLNALPPRTQGLVTLVIAAVVVVVGLAVAGMLEDQFYPIIFPAAGFITPMGLFQLLTGYSRDDMANQRVPRALMLGVLVACALGVVVGLEANKAIFGLRW